MIIYPRIILHQSKINAVKRFHPWVFSGAIRQKDGDLIEGDVVDLYSEQGDYLATGHYSPGNIAVKILSFSPISDLRAWFMERIRQSYDLRVQLGLVYSPATTCYRLVNSEGDSLPGLIIDWYNGMAVTQFHSVGMYAMRGIIVEALEQIYGQRLQGVYDKSTMTLSRKIQFSGQDGYLLGEKMTGEVMENGHRFRVDWETGQKTGLFLDQRENRQLLSRYAPHQLVLNTFCYSGGFSVYAIQSGARLVHSVDSSSRAIASTLENVELNSCRSTEHHVFTTDVFDFLKGCASDYTVMILDPPAFAKSLNVRHQAVMAYKRLNYLAFNKIQYGGIVFTFSCSQVVSVEQFEGAVMAGAIEAGREVRVLHHLNQPSDHPVSIFHPEGGYLKGLVLQVC